MMSSQSLCIGPPIYITSGSVPLITIVCPDKTYFRRGYKSLSYFRVTGTGGNMTSYLRRYMIERHFQIRDTLISNIIQGGIYIRVVDRVHKHTICVDYRY